MCESVTLERITQAARSLSEPMAQKALHYIEQLQQTDADDETAYLLREPANARRLLKAAENIRAGRNIQQRGLLPDD